MKDKLIQEYINRMTIKDVENFAINNGISLKSDELKLIYDYIIKDYRTIMYGNPRPILDSLKQKLDNTSYQKIEQLYINFKNRYL